MMGGAMPYAYKVEPGKKIRLRDYDPDRDDGMTKEEGQALFAQFNAELDEMQEQLYAAGQHSVLIILQWMDTSGKDGAIRNVLQNVNPQGCQVTPFKVPNEEELAHDFLWRAHRAAPRQGMIGVFNRSHYEDVLVVRVHKLVPSEIWNARYQQINDFEQILAANHTIILKFFLHISKAEQQQRLRAREQDVSKAWKLSVTDWKERQYWDNYTKAYEDALSKCSTERAPWYVVPANRKWYRNLAIAETIAAELKPYRKGWERTLKTMAEQRIAELQTYRAG